VPTGLDSLEMIDSTTDINSFLLRVQIENKESGLSTEDIEYADVVKKPNRNLIMNVEDTKENAVAKDWKSMLEAMYLDKDNSKPKLGTSTIHASRVKAQDA